MKKRLITGNWESDRHDWTADEVAFAAACWKQEMTQSEVADALADEFNFFVSRNSIASLIRVHRDVFARRIQRHAA